ncbi:NUDIX domain-containing protein [Candidatus Saccharibacteria bacterium]|nr:NUDIX domain-containing protein [Candidatus Saccharibacteria bacterium]
MAEVNKVQYTEATLCFLLRNDQVLLAEKQKKIGAGFLNGFGGKAEPGDQDIYDTNTREVEEEIGVRLLSAQKVGEVVFHNPYEDEDLRRMRVHIFTSDSWDGEPQETDEMKKIAWHAIESLDYERFLAADRLFLPQILGRQCIRGVVRYNDDWSVKSCDIDVVSDF